MNMNMNPVAAITDRLSSADDGPDADSPAQEADHTARGHTLSVSAESLETDYDSARSGSQWARTYFVTGWPDSIPPGVLDMVTTFPSSDVDVSIHASPRSVGSDMALIEGAITNLQKEAAMRAGRGSASGTQQRIHEHEAILADLRSGDPLFDVSVYITIRGEDKDDLDARARDVERILERQQISATPIDWDHDEGLVSTSPVAKDTVTAKIPDASTPMQGEALGALFPFSAATIMEDSGVPIGYHSVTDELVMIDRYARENGYNMLVMGEIGVGKSFGAKMLNLREMARRKDTVLIMVDPLSGFAELADTLNAERFVVGGRNGLNPLEIRPTPPEVIHADDDVNPYGDWFSGAVGFFESFVEVVGGGAGDGLSRAERSVLGEAIHAAARENGITREPETHDNPSPTVRQVEGYLSMIEDDAAAFLEAVDADREEAPPPTDRFVERWESAATDLRIALRPFRGEYRHLAGESEVDFHGSKALYLDIQQGESDRELALSMQPALNAVNERTKTTDKNVILCIDEAHYLMQNESSLDWLERLTRHSRHYNLSLALVTQQASDFLVNEQAKTIADNCSMKLIHKESGLTDGQAQALDLSEREADFVRRAKPGTKQRGYSHALLCVQDKANIPVRVTALPTEGRLIDADFPDPTGPSH